MSCPICLRASDPKYRPFCSRRCADVDLGRWLTGAYAIPAAEEDPDAPGVPDDNPPQH
ncbi:MAG: DNA gyrase inhibitor YacG [Paracoccaceae bacterium]|nr:DNA gyrase inhibitor YacG [Paracoccaceae bacterium]